MAKTRPDDNIDITFRRRGSAWEMFEIAFYEELDDQTHDPMTKRCTFLSPIADLPTQIKVDLLSAYNGMIAHRDSIDPIT